MNIERYETLLRAALEVQQLEILKSRQLKIIAENITASELSHRSFDNETATKALSLLKDVEVKEASYVTAQANYKDVEINLHCDPKTRGGEAMKNILKEINSNAIFKA